ncbi:MAG: hypothetical protein GY812_10970 [Actinomycetia bacterium]|nr:hypothetical protein [Actinomycetes bacterium]
MLRSALAVLAVLSAALGLHLASAAQLPLATSQVFAQDVPGTIPVSQPLALDDMGGFQNLSGRVAEIGGPWLVHRGWFQVWNGGARRIGWEDAGIASLDVSAQRVRVTSNVATSGRFDMAVAARVNNNGRRGIHAVWRGDQAGQLQIVFVRGGTRTVLAAQTGLPTGPGLLTLEVDGTQVTASIHGSTISATLTPAQDNALGGTRAGIWAYGSNSWNDPFTDFVVESLP